MIAPGRVWLVGAGPGDPELLTVKAARLLAHAEIVAYDELVSEEILALVPAHAERIPVGRRASGCRHHEGRIHPLVIERARAGRDVVRLKGGDPFLFGRGGEEAEELAAVSIACEVVPGISAAFGAAAASRIPLTHRDHASSVTFVTAHAATEQPIADLPRTGTIVLYMGLGRLRETIVALLASGRSLETPAAIVASATTPRERIVHATLGTLEHAARDAGIAPPALIFVGEVVAHATPRPRALDTPNAERAKTPAFSWKNRLRPPLRVRRPLL
jgi:uroporphyrin-III C-methyltransferase